MAQPIVLPACQSITDAPDDSLARPIFDALSATLTPDGQFVVRGHLNDGDPAFPAALALLDEVDARFLVTTLTNLLARTAR